ncbi:MAG: hypothetical protein PHQ23_05310 [Candidatus Wallbacteria bacterium]|nr:hypothetical protein [Candidatus Wallbacteria bacterium]
MNEQKTKELTHIAGTFLIQAEGSFLNGSTNEKNEGYDITTPKTLQEFNKKIPYVSAQAWRHWLRETYRDENPDDPSTPIETTGCKEGEGDDKEKFTTNKVGFCIDPIKYAEQDIFGYMDAKSGQGAGGVKATIRKSPFQSSILLSIRKSGWEGIDKGFVHPESIALSYYENVLDELAECKSLTLEQKTNISKLKKIVKENLSRTDLVKRLQEALQQLEKDSKSKDVEKAIKRIILSVPSPLPYQTRFYNTQLQGIFGIDFHRIGLFRNAGDREELEEKLVEKYLADGSIQSKNSADKSVSEFEVKDKLVRVDRVRKILKSLALLRGGAKQTQFGTDVSPKVIILAGLTCGNLIFNDLFEDTKEIVTSPREKSEDVVPSDVIGGVRIKIDALKEIIKDYSDRIITPVYIGYRKGYLSADTEKKLEEWKKNPKDPKVSAAIELCSPIEAINSFVANLSPKHNGNT